MELSGVIIKEVTTQGRNVQLAVYPFFTTYHIHHFRRRGQFDMIWEGDKLPEWHKSLSNILFDKVPGLQDLFFTNGEITLQHSGVLEDAEVIELTKEVITPFLEQELRLRMLDRDR